MLVLICMCDYKVSFTYAMINMIDRIKNNATPMLSIPKCLDHLPIFNFTVVTEKNLKKLNPVFDF